MSLDPIAADPRRTPRNQKIQLPFNREHHDIAWGVVRAFVRDRGGRENVHGIAIMSQIGRETGGSFDAGQLEIGSRTGVGGMGWMQFTNVRARDLVAFAAALGGSPADPQIQAAYMDAELRQDLGPNVQNHWGPRSWVTRFWAAGTAEEAAFAFLKCFLRPRTDLQTQANANVGFRKLPNLSIYASLEDAGTVVLASNTGPEIDTSSSGDVKTLQALLNALAGQRLAVDGIWGRRTASSVGKVFPRMSREQAIAHADRVNALFANPNQSQMV